MNLEKNLEFHQKRRIEEVEEGNPTHKKTTTFYNTKIFFYHPSIQQPTKSYPSEKHFLIYDKSCDIINT